MSGASPAWVVWTGGTTERYADFWKDGDDDRAYMLELDAQVVDQDLHQPPVWTKLWYATGALDRPDPIDARAKADAWQGDELAPWLSRPRWPSKLHPAESRQAMTARSGTELRTEVYAPDGGEQKALAYVVT